MSTEFLSVDQVAEKYTVSRATVWRWIKEMDIQRYRFRGDRKTYIQSDDLERMSQPMPTEPQRSSRDNT